jgi:hypothetical protein
LRPRVTDQNGGLPVNTVAQASGVISVQAGCSLNHAPVLMVLRAREANATLEQIAMAVVEREVRFDP